MFYKCVLCGFYSHRDTKMCSFQNNTLLYVCFLNMFFSLLGGPRLHTTHPTNNRTKSVYLHVYECLLWFYSHSHKNVFFLERQTIGTFIFEHVFVNLMYVRVCLFKYTLQKRRKILILYVLYVYSYTFVVSQVHKNGFYSIPPAVDSYVSCL